MSGVTQKPNEVTISGLVTPVPGTVLAVFVDDDGKEYTDPVLALFIRSQYVEGGTSIVLDGFVSGGGINDLFPVSDAENFRGFRQVIPFGV